MLNDQTTIFAILYQEIRLRGENFSDELLLDKSQAKIGRNFVVVMKILHGELLLDQICIFMGHCLELDVKSLAIVIMKIFDLFSSRNQFS